MAELAVPDGHPLNKPATVTLNFQPGLVRVRGNPFVGTPSGQPLRGIADTHSKFQRSTLSDLVVAGRVPAAVGDGPAARGAIPELRRGDGDGLLPGVWRSEPERGGVELSMTVPEGLRPIKCGS